MILLQKLKFHLSENKYNLTDLSEKFRLLSLIQEKSDQDTIKSTKLTKFIENFSKLNNKFSIASTLVERTEKRLLGLETVSNDTVLLERLGDHHSLKMASYSRLQFLIESKTNKFQNLYENVIYQNLHDPSTTLNINVFDYLENIRNIVNFSGELEQEIKNSEIELNREIEHLRLTGESENALKTFTEGKVGHEEFKLVYEFFKNVFDFLTSVLKWSPTADATEESDEDELTDHSKTCLIIVRPEKINPKQGKGTVSLFKNSIPKISFNKDLYLANLEENFNPDSPIFVWLFKEMIEIAKNIDILNDLRKILNNLKFDDFKDLLIVLNMYDTKNEQDVFKIPISKLLCNLSTETKLTINQIVNFGRNNSEVGKVVNFVRNVLDERLAIGDFIYWDDVYVAGEMDPKVKEGTLEPPKVKKRRDINSNIKYISNISELISKLKACLIKLGPENLEKDLEKKVKNLYDRLRLYEEVQIYALYWGCVFGVVLGNKYVRVPCVHTYMFV